MEDQGMEPMEPIPCLDLNDGYLTPQREEPELEPQQNDLGLTFRSFVTPDSPTHNTQETVETGVDHDFINIFNSRTESTREDQILPFIKSGVSIITQIILNHRPMRYCVVSFFNSDVIM